MTVSLQARSLLLGLSEPFLAVEQLRQKVGAGDLTVAQFRDVLKDSTEVGDERATVTPAR